MQLTEFLRELSVGELKGLADELGVSVDGKKAALVARIRRKVSNPFRILPLLRGETLRAFARDAGLGSSGTKDEVVCSLIRAHVLEADESDLCDFIIGQGISNLKLRLELAKTLRRQSSVTKVAGILRHSDDREVRGKARQMTKVGSEVPLTTLVRLLVEGKEEEIRAAAVALEGSMELAGRQDPVYRALAARRDALRTRQRDIEAVMGSSWKPAPQLREVLLSLWRVEKAPAPTVKVVEAEVERAAAAPAGHPPQKAPEVAAPEVGRELVLADLQKLERELVEMDLEVPVEAKMLDDRLATDLPGERVEVGAEAATRLSAHGNEEVDRLEIQVQGEAPGGALSHEDVVDEAFVVRPPTGMSWHASEPVATGMARGSAVMEAVRHQVEASPERVVEALRHLAGNRDLVLKRRVRIKRDLVRFARIAAEGEKRAFLKRSIEGYGSLVVGALHAQLNLDG